MRFSATKLGAGLHAHFFINLQLSISECIVSIVNKCLIHIDHVHCKFVRFDNRASILNSFLFLCVQGCHTFGEEQKLCCLQEI